MSADDRPTAIYVRVSTTTQAEKGAGLETQLASATRFCAERDWEVVATYVDRAESGRNENRPEIDRLMADCAAGKIGRVVLYRLDRLDRTMEGAVARAATLLTYGVHLAGSGEPIDNSTMAGRLLMHIQAAIAHHEAEVIRKRFGDGQENAARSGRWPAGPPPYGFRVVPAEDKGKVAIVDEAKAAVVRRIAQEYLAGRSTLEIAVGLAADQIPTPRKGEWDRGKVRKLLSSARAWWGGSWTYTAAGEPISIPMPRILDDDTIDAVEVALASRSFVRGPAATYPLSMRVTAPCGSHAIGHESRGTRQYLCSSRKRLGPGNCDCGFVAAEPLEEAAFLAISRHLRDRQAIEALIKARIDRVVALTGSADNNVDELARRVREIEVRIGEETTQFRSAGLSAAAIAAAIKPSDDELAAVTKMHAAALKVRRRAQSPTNAALAAWVVDDYAAWDEASPEQRREMFARLDVRVNITGWSECGECSGRGRVIDPEIITLPSGKRMRRQRGCPTCSGAGRIPHIRVTGALPAELVEHLAEVVDLAVPPGSDLAFEVDSPAAA
jgi:DNA invertase Pin-like site-specific DNA recombinase